MKLLTITNGFNVMPDATLETRAYQILSLMTDNPNFTAPVPAVADVSAIIGEFFDALSLCKEGDRMKIAIKNRKRQAVIKAMHQWAKYVLFIADGDDVVAMSSGFTIGKPKSPAAPIGKPENLVIASGINPGELTSKVNRVKDAVCYIHQYATDAMLIQQHWQSVPTSKTSCILANLQPGTKYYCRVGVLGAKNQLLYSDIVSRIVA